MVLQMMYKMKSKIAVFDCDDVLANLRDPLQDLVSEHLGRPVSWKEWDQYEIGKVYGFNFSHVCQMLVERDTLAKLQADPYAKQLIDAYKQDGCKTVILTARGYHPTGKQITEQWVADNNLPIDEVICIPLGDEKRDYLKHMGNVQVYVEDNHNHAEQAHGLLNVKSVYLLDRPWNRDVTNVTRVSCLSEILQLKSRRQVR
jgi:phosphoserine phosphatase